MQPQQGMNRSLLRCAGLAQPPSGVMRVMYLRNNLNQFHQKQKQLAWEQAQETQYLCPHQLPPDASEQQVAEAIQEIWSHEPQQRLQLYLNQLQWNRLSTHLIRLQASKEVKQ